MITSAGMLLGSLFERAARTWGVLGLCGALVSALGSCSRESAPRPTPESISLYDQGRYEEALPVLREERGADGESGAILYRIGYAQGVVERDRDGMMQTWGEAERLLEEEVSSEEGDTLERLYYLSKINLDQREYEPMRKYARLAVERFERGAEAKELAGTDWFRLGRMHEFLREASEAEAAYRRAWSSFQGETGGQNVYHALTALWIADLDFKNGEYGDAAASYDQALALAPQREYVHPFRHGLALLGAGRAEESIARFEAAQSRPGEHGDTGIEAQYAVDLARQVQAAGSLEGKDIDGVLIESMMNEMLRDRILDAAGALRKGREKYSYRPGDPVPSEVLEYQRRFVTLLRERLLRDGRIQEFCLTEAIADLVRQ
jgi:tetratricopeptide (TPR) repeat protein